MAGNVVRMDSAYSVKRLVPQAPSKDGRWDGRMVWSKLLQELVIMQKIRLVVIFPVFVYAMFKTFLKNF